MGDFDVEIESIRSTVTWMENNAIDTATKLQATLKQLNGYAVSSDWSGVPSCVAFGSSYNAAIEAYKKVADDLLTDAQKMSTALTKIADDYENADESSRARLDAAIANFAAAGYMTTSVADDEYTRRKDDLHSDNPEQAPAQDGDAASGNATPAAPAPTNTGNGRVRME